VFARFRQIVKSRKLCTFAIIKISYSVSNLDDGATWTMADESSTSAAASSMNVEFHSMPCTSAAVEVEPVVPTSSAGHLTSSTPADVPTSGVG